MTALEKQDIKELDILTKHKDRIEKINNTYALLKDLDSAADDWQINLQFGAYLKNLRESITSDQIDLIKNLQNIRIGFLTDRTPNGYDGEVLKNIVIEAMILGLRPIGNEFNILGGNLYVTRQGLDRLLNDLIERNDYYVEGKDNPEIATTPQGNYKLTYNVTVKDAQGNFVIKPIKKTYVIKAQFRRGDKTFELGIDAVQRKGQRKIDNLVYSRLTKRKALLPEGSVEDVDMPSISPNPSKPGKISVSQIINKSAEKQEETET